MQNKKIYYEKKKLNCERKVGVLLLKNYFAMIDSQSRRCKF